MTSTVGVPSQPAPPLGIGRAEAQASIFYSGKEISPLVTKLEAGAVIPIPGQMEGTRDFPGWKSGRGRLLKQYLGKSLGKDTPAWSLRHPTLRYLALEVRTAFCFLSCCKESDTSLP